MILARTLAQREKLQPAYNMVANIASKGTEIEGGVLLARGIMRFWMAYRSGEAPESVDQMAEELVCAGGRIEENLESLAYVNDALADWAIFCAQNPEKAKRDPVAMKLLRCPGMDSEFFRELVCLRFKAR